MARQQTLMRTNSSKFQAIVVLGRDMCSTDSHLVWFNFQLSTMYGEDRCSA